MKRYFEFKDETSNKFWEITCEDAEQTVRYGRIGTEGQRKTKRFKDAAEAQTESDSIIAEKLAKGYVGIVATQTGKVPTPPTQIATSATGQFADLLSRLDSCLKTQRPEYYNLLNPGVDEASLNRFEKHLGFSLPTEFHQLYRWHNGTMKGHDSFQHNMFLMPLDTVESVHDLLSGMIGKDFEEPDWWRVGWIPFLQGYGGNHLCIDTEGSER